MPANRLPAFQLYPGDWLKDPALRRCSKAARGALIDILCVAHECDFRGALFGGGTAWKQEEIADAIGGDRSENLSLISALLSSGPLKVWSKVSLEDLGTSRPDLVPDFPEGTIYNRRMVKDEIKRLACREAGIEGKGNPTLRPLKVTYKGKVKGKRGSSVEVENEDEIEIEAGRSNPIWDSISKLFFPDGIPPSNRSRVGSVVRDLKALSATPDEIERRYQIMRSMDWGKSSGPEGFVNQWANLKSKTENKKEKVSLT